MNVADYAFSGFQYDPISHLATWTLSQSVAADKLLLDLDGHTAGAVADGESNKLDGAWINPAWTYEAQAPTGGRYFPSGDGASGDFLFRINVLPGDVNQDGFVSLSDQVLIGDAAGTAPGSSLSPLKDLRGDGTISTQTRCWCGP